MNDPVAYDKSSRIQIKTAKQLIPKLLSHLKFKSNENVMDFGCGSGYVTRHVLLPALETVCPDLERKIYGIDISEEMVEFAAKHYSNAHITYLALDIQKDLPPCKFDKIFSSFVLHWIPDQLGFLEKAYQLLNTGGEICCFFTTKAPLYAVYDILRKDSEWGCYLSDAEKFIPKSFYSSNPAADFAGLMETAGFAVQECSEESQVETWKDMEELMKIVMAIDPFVGKVPLTMRESYKERFLQELLPLGKKVPTPDHPSGFEIESVHNILVVRGQKL